MIDTEDRKIVATIEARMTSSRLPGKVLLEACGKPMLELLIERLQRVQLLDEIVVATTTNDEDDLLVNLAERLHVGVYRGSENDVLARVLGAASEADAKIIVEITGDCPLIDPDITTQVIETYLLNNCDYASNAHEEINYLKGTDTEVFSLESLQKADVEGNTPQDREHVSWYFVRNPDIFNCIFVPTPKSIQIPGLAITLDEEPDYRLIKHIFEYFYQKKPDFSLAEVVGYLRNNSDVMAINEEVKRKTVND